MATRRQFEGIFATDGTSNPSISRFSLRAGFEETGILSLNFLSTIRFLDRNGKWREIFSEENLLECVSVGLSSGCVELRHTQEKIPRFLRRREETIVQVDEKKEARCDYSHAPPWGITSHSRQCAGSNRPRFCFGKDGSLKIVAWLRIIPNEPATISESDATCLHARRVSLSFSLPRHFRRLFSCYTSRAWLRMYNIGIRNTRTHARRPRSEKVPNFEGRGRKGPWRRPWRAKGGYTWRAMCTRVGERARWEEEKTPCVQVATDAFRGIRWAGEQQVVPENHAAGTSPR